MRPAILRVTPVLLRSLDPRCLPDFGTLCPYALNQISHGSRIVIPRIMPHATFHLADKALYLLARFLPLVGISERTLYVCPKLRPVSRQRFGESGIGAAPVNAKEALAAHHSCAPAMLSDSLVSAR